MKNENLIQQAIGILSKDEYNEEAINLLRRFLISNQQQPSGKFNIYNYVSKDDFRPVLKCVFHSGGFKVATDATIIIALARQDYTKELEGKLLNKTAEEINGEFPNWERVIPDKSQAADAWTIANKDLIVDAVKQQKQIKKERRDAIVAIEICGKHFNPGHLLKLIDFANHIGVNEINVGSLGSGASYCASYGEDGSVGLLMGLYQNGDKGIERLIIKV